MEITVTSRETIAPSSPTPHHLRHLKLKLIDPYTSSSTTYSHVILFYSAQGDLHRFQTTKMSDRLKRSLSMVLTKFYPLAGRFGNNQSIECNDKGLDYVEARVKAPFTLSRLVDSPKAEEVNKLLAYDPSEYGTDFDGKLSTVQVTVFDKCGGMAIGVSLSQVVADLSSLAMFVNSWAAVARGDTSNVPYNDTLTPKLNPTTLFPPRDIPLLQLSDYTGVGRPWRKPITKRFIFDEYFMDTLEARCQLSQCMTRVEALSALLLKCLINVTAKSSSLKCIGRMTPPLRMNHFGNMSVPGIMERIGSDNVRSFEVSGLCKFPFYEVDVGWGAPIWLASVYSGAPDFVTLIDAKNGGGIEAWVTLDEDDMARFEPDRTILDFISPISLTSRM